MAYDTSTPPPIGAEPQPTTPYGLPRVNPQPGFLDAIKMGLSRWNDFSGRSRRSEYWWFVLFVGLYSIAASLALLLVTFGFAATSDTILFIRIFYIGILVLILPIIVPHYALLTRRLHDSGKSGWWVVVQVVISVVFIACYFIMLDDIVAIEFGNQAAIKRNAVPLAIVGILYIPAYIIQLVIFVFTVLDSKREVNKWGASPKFAN